MAMGFSITGYRTTIERLDLEWSGNLVESVAGTQKVFRRRNTRPESCREEGLAAVRMC